MSMIIIKQPQQLLIRVFLTLLIWGEIVHAADVNNTRNCREKNRLIEAEKGDLYILIDAVLSQKLTLQCHYCNENDDQRPKIWYKIDDISNKQPHELSLDMNNNSTKQVVHVNEEHSLIINNFQANNTGLYYCARLEKQEEDEKYNYLVDIIYDDNGTNLELGNGTGWQKYYEDYFVPINTLFAESNGEEFKRVRDDYQIKMDMVTHWRPWGLCQVCGLPQNMGVKKKLGLCRIKLTELASFSDSLVRSVDNPDLRFLLRANAVSCHSMLLSRILPGISNLTRIIPNFMQSEHCEGTCNPDSEGTGKGWKAGKTSGFKYRKTVVLEQNSHLTVICPESALENVVTWKRNGKVLKPGESVEPPKPEDEPRIIVDTFNTLYLVDVRDSEEGNYTCEVDSTRMQQIVVFVISKSKILTQALVRYLIYLSFILSLTVPCYCAGLVIACSKRRSFKTYDELKELEEGPEKHKLYNN